MLTCIVLVITIMDKNQFMIHAHVQGPMISGIDFHLISNSFGSLSLSCSLSYSSQINDIMNMFIGTIHMQLYIVSELTYFIMRDASTPPPPPPPQKNNMRTKVIRQDSKILLHIKSSSMRWLPS